MLHLYSLCKFVSCYSRSIRHLAVNSFPVFSERLCTQCHRIPSQMKSTRRRRRGKNICANCVLDARFEQRKTPALSMMMEERVKEKESTECCFKQCSCFPCRFLRKQEEEKKNQEISWFGEIQVREVDDRNYVNVYKQKLNYRVATMKKKKSTKDTRSMQHQQQQQKHRLNQEFTRSSY